MSGLPHPLQQSGIPLEACTHAARPLPFLQQHLQVVQHQQHPPSAQLLQQQTETFFQGVGQVPQQVWGQHLQASIHERGAGRGITQGAKDDHLEVGRHPVHRGDHQRRLADAAHAQHTHHSTARLSHPLGEQRQFLLAPVEGGHIQRLAPIHPRSQCRLGHGLLIGVGLLVRLR